MPTRMILCLLSLAMLLSRGSAQQAQPETDLFALTLIEHDLKHASRLVTIYDLDDDRALDQDEQERVPWTDEVAQYDLDRNGKLTQSELALRQAKLRYDNDITKPDIEKFEVVLSRHDWNHNGQLDPKESIKGWEGDPAESDTNHDGILSALEMQRAFATERIVLRDMGIEAIDRIAAERIVKWNDRDRDKTLNDSEQRDLVLPYPVQPFDHDQDGKLAVMEIAMMLAKRRLSLGLTTHDQSRIHNLFKQYDLSRDSVITLDEAEVDESVEEMPSPLKLYDSNADNMITMQEVELFFADKRKSRGYIQVDYHRAVEMMRRHDVNGSKFIEESELFETPMTGQLSRAILSGVDQDKDKRVNVEELARYLATQRQSKEGR